MNVVGDVLDLFRVLRRADDLLQPAMGGLFERYYTFLRSAPRHGTRWLRLRRHRDSEGRVRVVTWACRTKRTGQRGLRTIRLVRELPGRLRPEWIYKIARDWANREAYFAFERERRALVAARQQVVKHQRALRLALINRWIPLATSEDLLRAGELIARQAPELSGASIRPLMGALALGRETARLEEQLGLLVEAFRAAFGQSAEVTFEPILTVRPNGRYRLSWGFPQCFHTPEGPLRITQYLPGRPTDILMRKLGIGTNSRRKIVAFLREMLPVEHRYRELVRFLGIYRRRVQELVVRVEKLQADSVVTRSCLSAEVFPQRFMG